MFLICIKMYIYIYIYIYIKSLERKFLCSFYQKSKLLCFLQLKWLNQMRKKIYLMLKILSKFLKSVRNKGTTSF